MYAIADIAGQQFKVEAGKAIYVHRLKGEEGANVSFEKVFLKDDNGAITVGNPVIDGAAVNATILKHVKGDKVIVFHKRRRKGYQKKNGHRQCFTQIQIDSIV